MSTMLTANTTQNRKGRTTRPVKTRSGTGKENTPPEAESKARGKHAESWDNWEEPWEPSTRAGRGSRRSSVKTRALQQRNSITPSAPTTRRSADDQWKAVSASADATLMVDGTEWSLSPTLDDNSRLANHLARFEATIVDKGYETIQTIGRVAATFATSLDTAIEQLVETLTVSDNVGPSPQQTTNARTPAASQSHTARSTTPASSLQQSTAAGTPAPLEEEATSEATTASSRPPRTGARSATPASTRSAPTPGSEAPPMSLDDAQKMELKKLRRVRHEYVKLRDRYGSLQADLRRHESRYASVCEENDRLKNQLMVMPDGDPLGEQVREQLQTLLTEKAALASENAQLQRQNASLQELLEYSLSQQMLALEASECRALATPLPRKHAGGVGDGFASDAEDVYQSDDDIISGSLFDKVDE